MGAPCFNLTSGGEHYRHSDETKARMSAMAKAQGRQTPYIPKPWHWPQIERPVHAL